MRTTEKDREVTKAEEQPRTVLLPNHITIPDCDLAEMADFLQTWSVYYLHSVLDSLIVQSQSEKLDPEERECLIGFMHTLGLLQRDYDTEQED